MFLVLIFEISRDLHTTIRISPLGLQIQFRIVESKHKNRKTQILISIHGETTVEYSQE